MDYYAQTSHKALICSRIDYYASKVLCTKESEKVSQNRSEGFLEHSESRVFFERARKNYQEARVWVNIFKDCEKVLDLGCSTGVMQDLDKDKFIGLDISHDLVKKLKGKGYNVVKGNATDVPFPDEYFDGVMVKGLIEHLFPQDAYKMLSECGRMLKPNGKFAILCTEPTDSFWRVATHIRPYPRGCVKRMLDELGGWEVKNYIYRGISIKGLRKFFPDFHRKFVNKLAQMDYRRHSNSILIARKNG